MDDWKMQHQGNLGGPDQPDDLNDADMSMYVHIHTISP